MLELGRNVKNAVQFFSQTTMRNLMEQLQGGEMWEGSRPVQLDVVSHGAERRWDVGQR